MNDNDILNAIGNVGDDLIEKNARLPSKKTSFVRKGAIAACACSILILLSFGCYTIAADAAQYREAVCFFEENDLELEGLSYNEVKAVYKDIIMQTFSYEKTAYVLNILSVETYNVELGAKDRDTLRSFWENRNSDQLHNTQTKFKYSYDSVPLSSSTSYSSRYYQYAIYCHNGETMLWEYRADPNISLYGIEPFGNGVVAYGKKMNQTSLDGYAFVFMLDDKGDLIWEYSDSHFLSVYQAALIDNENIVLFGCQEQDNIHNYTFTKLSADGELLNYNINYESDHYMYLSSAVRVGDGYLVKGNNNSIVSFDLNGNPIDFLQYYDGDTKYKIVDMFWGDDRLFISAYTFKFKDTTAAKNALAIELQYNHEYRNAEEPPQFDGKTQELFTNAVGEAYTATLLICTNDGVIKKAYSTSYALPTDALVINNEGNIVWKIHKLDKLTPLPPNYSSTGYFADVTDFELTFNQDGVMIKKIRTSESYTTRIY